MWQSFIGWIISTFVDFVDLSTYLYIFYVFFYIYIIQILNIQKPKILLISIFILPSGGFYSRSKYTNGSYFITWVIAR